MVDIEQMKKKLKGKPAVGGIGEARKSLKAQIQVYGDKGTKKTVVEAKDVAKELKKIEMRVGNKIKQTTNEKNKI